MIYLIKKSAMLSKLISLLILLSLSSRANITLNDIPTLKKTTASIKTKWYKKIEPGNLFFALIAAITSIIMYKLSRDKQQIALDNDALRVQHATTNTQNSSFRITNAQFQQFIEQLNERNNILERENTHLTSQCTIPQAPIMNDQAVRQIQILTQEKNNIMQELTNLQKHHDEIINESALYREELRQAKLKQILVDSEKEGEMHYLQTDIDKLKQEIVKLKIIKLENNSLKVEITKLKQQIDKDTNLFTGYEDENSDTKTDEIINFPQTLAIEYHIDPEIIKQEKQKKALKEKNECEVQKKENNLNDRYLGFQIDGLKKLESFYKKNGRVEEYEEELKDLTMKLSEYSFRDLDHMGKKDLIHLHNELDLSSEDSINKEIKSRKLEKISYLIKKIKKDKNN